MCVFTTQQIPAKKGFYCSARSDSVTSWFPLNFVLAIRSRNCRETALTKITTLESMKGARELTYMTIAGDQFPYCSV